MRDQDPCPAARSSPRRGWRSEEVAQPADGLDDIDVQLLADAANEHFDGVGIAVEILVVEMFNQLGAGHHSAGMVRPLRRQASSTEIPSFLGRPISSTTAS